MNKEVILLNIRMKLDVIGSFVAGFGNRNNVDVNNAIFIAKELLALNLPLDFRGEVVLVLKV